MHATFTVAKLHRGIGDFTLQDEGRLRNSLKAVSKNEPMPVTDVTFERKDVPYERSSGATDMLPVITCTMTMDGGGVRPCVAMLDYVQNLQLRTGLPYIAFGPITLSSTQLASA